MDTQTIGDYVRMVAALAEEHGVRLLFVMEAKDGTIETGWYECDAVQHQIMVSHAQMDIVNRMMRATYELEKKE